MNLNMVFLIVIISEDIEKRIVNGMIRFYLTTTDTYKMKSFKMP